MRPFVVFSLPRSRSAWLSVFLGSKGLVGHDIGVECATPEDFVGRLRGPLRGTCETGAAFAWPLIRRELPDAKFAMIVRSAEEVENSLDRFGLTGLGPELRRRQEDMTAGTDWLDTMTLHVNDLRTPEGCAQLHEWCLGEPMDVERWRHLDALNIQVDMPRQIERLVRNRPQIDALKAAVHERLQ